MSMAPRQQLVAAQAEIATLQTRVEHGGDQLTEEQVERNRDKQIQRQRRRRDKRDRETETVRE